MRPITHIQLQTTAVFLLIYFALFFLLKIGLDRTYGENPWYFLIIMPPVYVFSRRVMAWYQKRAIKLHNKRIERGKPW